MPGWLNKLGKFHFISLSMQTRDLTDISEAISSQQKAVQLTPEGHANMPTFLNNLGISFMHCFQTHRGSH
jgi:hypothetical protein